MSKLYDNAKAATLTEIRALKCGDVIEAYYMDSEEPILEVIFDTGESPAKKRDAFDLTTYEVSTLFNGRRKSVRSALNTDKFKKIGRVQITLVPDTSVEASLYAPD